jgi:PAS domain S-box-containing protein
LGYCCQEIENKSYLQFVHPEDRQLTLETIERLGLGQEVRSFVNRFLMVDGTYCYLEWRAVQCEKLIYATARDITNWIKT